MNGHEDDTSKVVAFNLLKYVSYATIIAAFVAVVTFIVWSVQSPDVLTVNNNPLPVRPPQNTAGNVEYVHLNYCKKIDVEGTVALRMVGKKSVIRLPFSSRDRSPAQCLNTEIPIVIPTYAVDDTYYFEFDIEYRINPIKTQSVILKSQPFTIKSNGIIKVLNSGDKK